MKLAEPEQHAASQSIFAFLENELGSQALARGDDQEAARRFVAAIDLDTRTAPAYLNLGDVKLRQGRVGEAIAAWEQLVDISPERAYLAFDRLESAYPANGSPEKFGALCHRLIAANPKDWRARLALAGEAGRRGEPRAAFDLLLEALTHNPHALTVHQAIWRTLVALDLEKPLVERYIERTGSSVFYLDPHVCLRCHYRSTELLWQCPHCHDWNSFVEERIAPAKDAEEAVT
jgi:lipopolysaccharide biosynthesis regulator YciM